MRIHFIAIGGAVMHNLAIALHRNGHMVTGSDDEIYEPSRSNLATYGLLPPSAGWFPDKIHSDLDAVILGMHARSDNPELKRAQKLGIKIMSFPEFLYDQTRNKKRIVVAGSHGKTTVTSMIMHVFRHAGMKFSYMAGSSLKGFDLMVGLSDDSEIAVFEGDEYPASALDKRPKFLLYKPDIAILNGISWDHMNVYKTEEEYIHQFRIFAESVSEGGTLIYFKDDPLVNRIASEVKGDINKIPYRVHGYFINKIGVFGATHNRVIPLKFFGEHNMQNLSAAREACFQAGITEDQFYEAIQSFEGAAGRLQILKKSDRGIVFYDFAHSPSKVKATIEAVAETFAGKRIVACLELHTYSSLNAGFLPQYRNTMDRASVPYVFFSPHAVELKKLPPLNPDIITGAFCNNSLRVFSNADDLFSDILREKQNDTIYLFMSSGNFDGYNLKKLADELV